MSRTATSAPRTGRTWKAVAATGAAVALLAAGGATFAEWSDSSTVDSGTTITSGELKIESEGGVWTNAIGQTVSPANYIIVPGEKLTYTENLEGTAVGDRLTATLDTSLDALTGDEQLREALVAGATMSLNGEEYAQLTAPVSAADGETQELEVVVTVDFGFNSVEGLVAQGQSVALNDMTVGLTQNLPTIDAGN